MSGKNELYSEAMKNSIKLREVIDGMTQEQAERVSLYYAIGYMGSTPEEIEEAQAWIDQRWTEAELNGGIPINEPEETSDIEEKVNKARFKGGRAFRYVLVINGYTYTGEALHAYKFLENWEDMINRPELNRVEYGVPAGDKFVYDWRTL